MNKKLCYVDETWEKDTFYLPHVPASWTGVADYLPVTKLHLTDGCSARDVLGELLGN